MARITLKEATGEISFRSRIKNFADDPVFVGKSTGKEYVCHSCGHLLMKDIDAAYVVDIVIICGKCDAANETKYRNAKHLHLKPIKGPITFPDKDIFEIEGSVTVHDRVLVTSHRVANTFDVSSGHQA